MGSRRNAALVLVALALAALGFFAKTRWWRSGDVLATVAEIHGTVDRDVAAHVGAWKPAELQAALYVGDGVRTAAAAKAVLTLSDRSKLALDPETVVRFLDRKPSSHEQRFALEMGDAVLEAGAEPVYLGTDIGLAVISPGTKLTLHKSDQKVRYEVSVGMARFESGDGKSAEVTAGHGIEIGIGTATLEPFETKPAAAPSASAAAPSASAAVPEVPPPTGDVSAHVTGGGATVRAPGATTFARLGAGDSQITAGSTLRLAKGTSAAVERGGQRVTLRGSGEFLVAESGKPFIVAQGGGVSLTGADAEVQVSVPGGSIVAKLGAKGDVGIQKDGTHVSVTAGAVELHTETGTENLAAGEEGTIGAKGATAVEGRGPGYVDFVAGAGASFAVHDPKPPTAIGFATGGLCPEGAVVELVGRGGSRARGQGTVSVLFPSGGTKYAIRCVTAAGVANEPAASGSVSVIADSGTARIPRTAPATQVDTDGRSYTVLYQNLLPKISVRWPKPPAAGPFTLRLASPGGKSEAFTTASPSYSFGSGALREGQHRLTFEGGGTRSKETRVDIKFDNAAPTATLTSPQNGSFAPGGGVTVSGIALEGWKISVGGAALPLDDQLRFSGEAQAPAGQRALAIEFVHPRRGVHYYLRRAGQ